ncbi:MAG: phosphate ABC transporter substrate-binding protein [Chlorobiales bacterium]|nr:phosphate ABC transporter substrate-binding protein [Chlorobiales bacterium]
MKKLVVALFLALSVFGVKAQAQTITVKGSDTMVILAQRWAEKYMASHPGVKIQVTGGGSGTGISALINGTTDICNASRPMKSSEIGSLKQRYGTLGVKVPCAKDGVSIYVNESNPVKELTMAQIKDIYMGKITNWKQVGGSDAKIIVYGRENSSGTYVFFKDHVLEGADYTSAMQSMPGTAAVVNAVSKDKNSVGYGGAAYAVGVKHCMVKKDDKSAGVFPTAETIAKNQYPITRYLYLYLRNRPTGDIKKYVDWILSPAGQSIVTELGYFPVK